MFLDANTASASAFERHWDVCVVGTGPAGMTLARRLAAQGFDVALMEAGDLEVTWESQDFYQGAVAGMAYYDLDVCRLRTFGGTSQHWGGRCRALEAYNFEPLPYHRLSGWPIAKSDLDPYSEEADSILDLIPASAVPDMPVGDGLEELVDIRFRQSTPTRFADKYSAEIQASAKITLIHNAALVDLRLSENGAAVTGAVFRPSRPGGADFGIQARFYSLCLGGLENPRFLLNANSQIPAGIGNQHDLVGRYFCERPTYRIADVLFDDRVPPSDGFMPTLAAMKHHETLSFNLMLETRGDSLTRAAARSLACSGDFMEDLAKRVLGHKVDCGRDGFFGALEVRRSGADRIGTLGIILEQELNPDSRVTLGDDLDAFGQRRIVLDWRLTERDVHTMYRAAEFMGRSLAARGYGRLKIHDWLRAEPADIPQMGEEGDHQVAIHHHLCTTRMSADPREGVVDADCRVHGIDNLHLGGSSVFATAGFANPTYTIVQMALRLGDHLGQRLTTARVIASDA